MGHCCVHRPVSLNKSTWYSLHKGRSLSLIPSLSTPVFALLAVFRTASDVETRAERMRLWVTPIDCIVTTATVGPDLDRPFLVL